MSQVMIENPNDKSVDVRVIGKSGGWIFGSKTDQRLHVNASSSGMVVVPKGKYYIRYRFADSNAVWEGDSFSLDDDTTAKITLQAMAGGNYATRPAGEAL